MNHSTRFLFAKCFQLMVLVGGAWLLIGPSWAQDEGFQPADPLKGGDDSKFRAILSGKTEPPFSDDDKKLIDRAAKWYANRLTWPRYQGVQDDSDKTDKKTMYNIVDEALKQIVVAPDPQKPLPPARQEYMKEFGKAMSKYLKKVVKNERPITRVNAARVLAELAHAGTDEAADILIDVLKDPNESDAVKLYAARGLKELFAVKQPDAKREARYIQVLLDYLTQKSSGPTDKPPEEEDALRFVRREVIRALGESRYPALGSPAKVDATAWWLLRVVRKDKITPEPNLAEQIEAAVGVCQLVPNLPKDSKLDYNVDVAAYHVGRFIVEFIGHSNNRTNLQPPNNGGSIAWKASAARLSLALDKLLENAPKSNKSVAAMVPLAQAVLVPIEKGKPAEPVALSNWLNTNTPKTNLVFKAVPASSLPMP